MMMFDKHYNPYPNAL